MSDPAVPQRRYQLAAALVGALVLVSLVACSTDKGTTYSDKGSKAGSSKSTTTSAGPDASGKSTSKTTSTLPKHGPDDNSPAAYVDGLAEQISSNTTKGGLGVPADDAHCLAQRWVDIITVARLRDHQVTAAEFAAPGFEISDLALTPVQADAMVAGFAPCHIDLYRTWLAAVGSTLTKAQSACVAKHITDAQVHQMMSAAMRTSSTAPNNPIQTLMQDVSATCHLNE
jgi:hypothetical protein